MLLHVGVRAKGDRLLCVHSAPGSSSCASQTALRQASCFTGTLQDGIVHPLPSPASHSTPPHRSKNQYNAEASSICYVPASCMPGHPHTPRAPTHLNTPLAPRSSPPALPAYNYHPRRRQPARVRGRDTLRRAGPAHAAVRAAGAQLHLLPPPRAVRGVAGGGRSEARGAGGTRAGGGGGAGGRWGWGMEVCAGSGEWGVRWGGKGRPAHDGRNGCQGRVWRTGGRVWKTGFGGQDRTWEVQCMHKPFGWVRLPLAFEEAYIGRMLQPQRKAAVCLPTLPHRCSTRRTRSRSSLVYTLGTL